MVQERTLRRTARRAERSSNQRSSLGRVLVFGPGEGYFNDDDEWVDDTQVFYEGIGVVERAPKSYAKQREDSSLQVLEPYLRVPAAAPFIPVGSSVRVLECRDESFVGSEWLITEEQGDMYGVHRRYAVSSTRINSIDRSVPDGS